MVDLFELFKEKAEALASEVKLFKTEKEALNFIKDYLKENLDPSKEEGVVWYNERFLEERLKEDLVREFPQISFEITPEVASKAKIGINEVEGAIAETGSLIEISDRIQKRLVSTLPEIHLAILSKSKIFPDLKTALKALRSNLHTYVTFISGPSRTADIERVLTIGVHGPEKLIILCIEDW